MIGGTSRSLGSERSSTRPTPNPKVDFESERLGLPAQGEALGFRPFADKYVDWTQEKGMHPSTARRNVARSLASTLWSLWKTGSQYDPALVRGNGRPSAGTRS